MGGPEFFGLVKEPVFFQWVKGGGGECFEGHSGGGGGDQNFSQDGDFKFSRSFLLR